MVTNVINTKYKKQVQCAKKAIISNVKNIPTIILLDTEMEINK